MRVSPADFFRIRNQLPSPISRLAVERLEARLPMAVTAGLDDGGDLQIALHAAGDAAVLRCDGGHYIVSGSGLRHAVVVDVADVRGAIRVEDPAGKAGQSFSVAAGAAISSPLQVDAGVETAALVADIATVSPGDVSIGSPRITLAGRISTRATGGAVDFLGAVTLARPVTIDAGAGYVAFESTLDGPFRLVARSSILTGFGGTVGGRTPLASLATDAGGWTFLGGNVFTSGAGGQAFRDDVALGGDVTIAALHGGVRFAGTVDSYVSSDEPARSLTVRSDITTVFGGAVGAMQPLARLVTKGPGTTVISGGSVTTAPGGRQVYGQPVRLTKSTVLKAGDGPIRFAGTVDGAGSLTPGVPADLGIEREHGRVRLTWQPPENGGAASLRTVTTGLTTFAGAVGARVPLQSVPRERVVFRAPVRTIPILDYVIQSSVDGGATWQSVADGYSSTTTATVEGVDDGRSYDVRVWAVNAAGEGAATTGSVTASGGIVCGFIYDVGGDFWAPEARRALTATAAAVSSTFVVSVPVSLTFSVTAERDATSRILAFTNSDLIDSAPGFRPTVVQQKILTGVDPNGTARDGVVHWNFGYGWAFGDAVTNDQFDFVAVLTHEMLHAFGFLSYVTAAGTNTTPLWTTFDRLLVAAGGASVIDPVTFQWNTAYDPSITGGQGGLYFGGPQAVAVYGGPVPLCTPGEYLPGSSVSHLDDETFSGSDEKLMNAFKTTGPGIRVLSPVELAILADLGYTIAGRAS